MENLLKFSRLLKAIQCARAAGAPLLPSRHGGGIEPGHGSQRVVNRGGGGSKCGESRLATRSCAQNLTVDSRAKQWLP